MNSHRWQETTYRMERPHSFLRRHRCVLEKAGEANEIDE